MGYWEWTGCFTAASLVAILIGGLIAHLFIFELDEDDKRHRGPKRVHAKRPETRAQFFERAHSPNSDPQTPA
jgi:hypothetical protein